MSLSLSQKFIISSLLFLNLELLATANVTLKNGLPVVKIISLTLPFPKCVQDPLEQEIQRQLGQAAELPVRFTSAE